MHYAQIFLLLLGFVAGLGLIARRIGVPYPILFVIGGLGITFVPGLPRLRLDPDFIFFLFLPPLLYIQAFNTSWRDFRHNLRAISLLAFGLVLATTLAVAAVAHAFIPNFSFAAGLVLGAIVSPPDAIAVAAIANQMGLPRRVVTILEGESLVNDATGLVAFKMALAAATAVALAPVTWRESLGMPLTVLYVAGGGIVVGGLVGLAVGWTRHRVMHDGSSIVLTLSIMTPYVSYLAAEPLGVSGILAVVTTGFYLSWHSAEIMTAATRLQANAFWDIIIYLLNGTIFVLIGLQLPEITHAIRDESWASLIFAALVVNLTCIGVRLVWVYPGAYLPRLFASVRRKEPRPDPRAVFIIGWAGMRGVVSLAAALVLSGVPPFPGVQLVQFLAFSVILVTLVFQGLTLPLLIRWFGLERDDLSEKEEADAREKLSHAALHRIETARTEKKFARDVLDTIEKLYRDRALVLNDKLAEELGWSDQRYYLTSLHQLRRHVMAAERHTLLNLRQHGHIGDDVMHKIERELDLEEARLKL